MALKDDLNKLKLLDSLFHAFTLEEMIELAGADLVVSKLRGVDTDYVGPMAEIYETMIRLRDDNTMLKSQLFELKIDIQDIVRILSAPPIYNQHLQNLKSRHSIY